MLSLRRRLSFALAATLLALTLAVPSHADEVVEEPPPDPTSFELPASEPLQPPSRSSLRAAPAPRNRQR